ncbi:hypothetical protein NDS46_31730 (plasmid) [Paenibacillus thiaminolyticus]|uniref:hypothetical protein n=1 Tax=Paenibacillus thiaminolyticus TaxID=49283 RepID=UPI00232AD500|nr:hypothetical protein [Paenibacillus thiaminolyticus]WCF11530.1 hypothetical protein NDS46_31730 [Paenibacillus thiaminolyticus]
MKNFYLNSIYGLKRKSPNIYKSLQREVFGSELTWEKMRDQPEDKLRHMTVCLEERILLSVSPIDPEKLAKAIQHSRSGIGGTAMTRYSCKLCRGEDVWTNTATPGICKSCAKKMALNIAKYFPDIFKDEN